MIRIAELSDLESVLQITRDTISEIYSHYYPEGVVDFFLQHHSRENVLSDIENQIVWLLEEEGSLVGTVTIKGNAVNRLFVLPQYQSHGYGSQIMDFAEDKIAEKFSYIHIDSSLAAKEMYLKRGYREKKTCRIQADNGDILIYDEMEKRVNNRKKSKEMIAMTMTKVDIMKTLILNGSPRINGDTSSLIDKITEKIAGEYKIVDAYRCNISPCIDCRYCWENNGCTINDEMQEIYKYIQECDNILIASPLYFSELTGKLLDVGSRLQTYFCSRFFRKEEPIKKSKKGAVILVGGGDGNIDTAYSTACTLLHHMNCYNIHDAVYSHNTNERPAIDDKNALLGLNSILDFFK